MRRQNISHQKKLNPSTILSNVKNVIKLSSRTEVGWDGWVETERLCNESPICSGCQSSSSNTLRTKLMGWSVPGAHLPETPPVERHQLQSRSIVGLLCDTCMCATLASIGSLHWPRGTLFTYRMHPASSRNPGACEAALY